MMQTSGGRGGSDAHETTRAEPLVVALACGDVEWRGWAGVGVLDGKVRFGVRGGREAVVVREMRRWVGEVVAGVGRKKKGRVETEDGREERDVILEEVWREVVEKSWGGERK